MADKNQIIMQNNRNNVDDDFNPRFKNKRKKFVLYVQIKTLF